MAANVMFLIDPEKTKQHWSIKHVANDNPLVQAETLRNELDKAWRQNEDKVLSTIENITGLEIVGEFKVFVLPPDLEEAQYVDARTIEWGRHETYDNSMVIGIAHELIHCITHDFYSSLSDDEKWLFHALVYLSADEEVRFALNGRSDYFDMPTFDGYHERLVKSARILLPYWKERLTAPQRKNIIDFFGEIKTKVG